MTGSRSSPGVIPLAANEVFSHVKQYPDREFFFRLSYIEIYNEVVIDLLDPTKTGLQVRIVHVCVCARARMVLKVTESARSFVCAHVPRCGVAWIGRNENEGDCV